MNARPRAGMKTPLVEVSGAIVPSAAALAALAALGCALVPRDPSQDAAPSVPAPFSHNRRVTCM
jgi:hypothetical protein